jgi:hypothetical protein
VVSRYLLKHLLCGAALLGLAMQCGCGLLADMFNVRDRQYDAIDQAAQSPSARIQWEAAAGKQELDQSTTKQRRGGSSDSWRLPAAFATLD